MIDKYLPNFNCVQATNFKLILHLHYWDLCIIDRYLPKFDSVQGTNVSLILHLQLYIIRTCVYKVRYLPYINDNKLIILNEEASNQL